MADGFEGMDRLRASIAASPAHGLQVAAGALYREANSIMNDSQHEVPVDKGILKASGVVQLPELSGDSATVTLGFGGAARAYAVIQHERTDFRHTVGKDHYLSDPINAHMPGIEGRMADDIASQQFFPGV